MIKIVNVNANKLYDYEASVFARYDTEYTFAAVQNSDELIAAAKDAEVILFTSACFTEEVFAALPKLKLLVRYGIGYDTVDLTAARAHGVDVCNAPTYGTIDVAEHAMALLLAANRKILSFDAGVREGEWGKSAAYPTHRLKDTTLGLVGLGRIARNVAQYAQGFGMKTIAYDPYIKPEDTGNTTLVSLGELLRTSDYISLHAPLTEENRHMICRETLAQCKPNAVLVNTSRGGLIDTDALAEALRTGVIRGAGLDVLETEPMPENSPLTKLTNVVLTPHTAWLTEESVVSLHEEVTAEVVRFLKGQPNLHIVNR
ncbi:MAG: C-terminal binding protein [Clostridiaceae bacterium]|nr:C-terminal binding protein [Clostridiaceae bacterium]